VGQHLRTYAEFPPRQKPGGFNLDEVMKKLTDAQGSGQH
jgi:arylsulfatase